HELSPEQIKTVIEDHDAIFFPLLLKHFDKIPDAEYSQLEYLSPEQQNQLYQAYFKKKPVTPPRTEQFMIGDHIRYTGSYHSQYYGEIGRVERVDKRDDTLKVQFASTMDCKWCSFSNCTVIPIQ